jgi:4-hydroxybenzoate polyprenyltransferase
VTGGRAWSLLSAAHLAPTLLVTALTGALAVAVGRGVASWLVAAATLAGQLSVGWSNDARDAERDRRAGRRDKPVATGAVAVRLLWVLAASALLVAIPLSWLAGGPDATAVHLLAIGAGWAYNLGLKATAWSWLPYAVAFALLPAFVWLGLPGSPWPPWWVAATAALLGAAAHLANALPDRSVDLRTGTGGIVVRMSPRAASGLLGALLLAAVATAVLGASGSVATGGWVALAAGAALAWYATRSARQVGDRGPLLALAAVAAIAIGVLASAFV